MNKIQFLFFDLDGTLLDDRKQMNEACIDYLRDLKRRKHLHFGFSTGRHEVSVTPYLDRHNLREFFDGMVCNTGSDIYYFDPPMHIKSNYLAFDTLKLILDMFQGIDFLTVAFHNGHQLVAARMNKEVQSVLDRNAYKTCYSPQELTIQEAPKCLLLFDPKDREKVEQVLCAAHLQGLHGIFTEANICEILSIHNTKASGAAEFLKRYRLSLQDIMVFGDAENDRHLMDSAGISVCMKNGSDDIKALADYITEKTNNENGIMDFLIKHEALF